MENTPETRFFDEYRLNEMMPDPASTALEMLADMKEGLAGRKSFMPMIPTYLGMGNELPLGVPVGVIDAGGTNFRVALLKFNSDSYEVEYSSKTRMPGTEKPVSWEELIRFIGDQLEPIAAKTDVIGFCFSYSAVITPELDGRVLCMDKEVKVPDAPGKLVGKSLADELERRGFGNKKVIVVNDTAAVMLGASCGIDKTKYSSFIGQVSGTGTNTCCAIPESKIGKLNSDSRKDMIINLESGMFGGIARTGFDMIMDEECDIPGDKLLEKLTAGAYLSKILRIMLKRAFDEGLISGECFQTVKSFGNFNTATVSEWAYPENTEKIFPVKEERELINALCRFLLKRSAMCMCANLSAIMLLENDGITQKKPICICAEGSLVQRSDYYRECLFDAMKVYAQGKLGLSYEFIIGDGTTLPGTAAAALLNS